MGASQASSHVVRARLGAGAQHVWAAAGILAALSKSDRALLRQSAVRVLTCETPAAGRARSWRRPVEHVMAGACPEWRQTPAAERDGTPEHH